MSRRRLAEVDQALSRGDMRAAASLIDVQVLAMAHTPEIADRLRIVRAFAQLEDERPREALATLAMMTSAWRNSTSVYRIAVAAHLRLGELATAERQLRVLVKRGVSDAQAVQYAVLARGALFALGRKAHRKAIKLFGRGSLKGIGDRSLRYAAWLGWMAASIGAREYGDVARVFAQLPEWHGDERANVLAARAVISCNELAAINRHIARIADAEVVRQLEWQLCQQLFAQRMFEQLLDRFRHRAQAPRSDLEFGISVLVALSYGETGEAGAAVRVIDALAGRRPNNPAVIHAAAHIHARANHSDKALEYLRRIPVSHEPARLLRWALAFQRRNYRVLLNTITPEAVRRMPKGEMRRLAMMLGALASALCGEPARAHAVLNAFPEAAGHEEQYLRGYIALALQRWDEAENHLIGSKLHSLVNIEAARNLADLGRFKTALRKLQQVQPPTPLVVPYRETIGRVCLGMVKNALRDNDFVTVERLLKHVRKNAPILAEQAAMAADYLSVRKALDNSSSPHVTAEALWAMHADFPAELPEKLRHTRQRDLPFLAATLWLRALEGAPHSTCVEKIVRALEQSLFVAPRYAPAAALLGLILDYREDHERSQQLLDIAQRQGITSPAIRAAIVTDYMRKGRLLEAKRIYFSQLSESPSNASAGRHLRHILLQEPVRRLVPEQGVSPRRDTPKVSLDVDPFEGIDPKRRIVALIHRIDAQQRGSSEQQQSRYRHLARGLKRMLVNGDFCSLAPLERQALATLNRGAT